MKTYLGDGVYAEVDPVGTIILTTEDGISITNTIYFEPMVLLNFMDFVRHMVEPEHKPQ